MKVKQMVVSFLYAFLVVSVAPVAAQAQSKSDSVSNTSSNGSSTGVGNAGSFGIGSGTSDSDSIATATAISNGVVDNSVDNSVDSSTTIATTSVQDLQASNTNNQINVSDIANPTSATMQTGDNTVSGNAFATYAGILSNGWNSGPVGIAQAATNVAVNGNLGAR